MGAETPRPGRTSASPAPRRPVVPHPRVTLRLSALTLIALLATGGRCSGRDAPPPQAVQRPAGAVATGDGESQPGGRTDPGAPSTEQVTLSVVGLNDLHGHVERLPIIAGYVENLRRVRRRDGGSVLVVDAGDLFQGTLASNLGEGQAVVDGYEALGVVAAAVGNHEFDYGPVGEDAVVEPGGDGDPRGALKARAAEADFPLLLANVLDAETRTRVDWPNMPPTHLLDVAGVRVGIIGVTTAATLNTTLRANVRDLAMAPLAETAAREARRLREEEGAQVVILTAHAGGDCDDFDDPEALGSCQRNAEIFRVVRALPEGAVDLVLAGHTHQGIAHLVAGVPVIESFAYGRFFGRVDLTVDRASGRVVAHRIHPPQRVCAGDERPGRGVPVDRCEAGSYEGAPVRPVAAVSAAIAPHLARAEDAAERSLEVRLAERFEQRYRDESSLGNLLTDLMRAARPRADVALQNGGGIRDDLSAGPLRYGDFYETFPFDNRFAFVRLTAGDLAELVLRNLRAPSGFLSLSGVRVEAGCVEGSLAVRLRRADGEAIPSETELTVVTNEYVVTAGNPVLDRLEDGAIEIEDGPPLRDVLARHLQTEMAGQTLTPKDYFDPDEPRVRFPGRRPVRCR